MSDAERDRLLLRFREEADEHIDELSKRLLSLEARPEDDTIVADLLRHAHSLKGASKLVGGTALERVTHAVETLLAAVRAKRIAPVGEVADTLIASVDSMRTALDRLMEGVTDTGAEGIVSKLLSLAASGPGLDQRVTTTFPGLDPEIRDVLTEFQKSQLVLAQDVGKTVREWELDANEAQFSMRIDGAYEQLKQIGDVISLAGLSSSRDDRLRFKFLVATRKSQKDIDALATSLSLILIDPAIAPKAGSEQMEMSDEEAEFAAEMAKLVTRYVTEAADEVAEAGKLILALESNPDDQATLNTLFRTAHNLKGSGMTYGLAAVSELAHHLETLLDALRQRKVAVSTRVTNALLTAIDALKDVFARARDGHTTATVPPGVLRLLDELSRGQPIEAPAEKAAVPRARPQAPLSETIRVRLDKLDRLINLAGELTVIRNAREAAAQRMGAPAEGARQLRRQWHSLRERLDHDESALATLRDSGWLNDFEDFGQRVDGVRSRFELAWNGFTSTTSMAQAATDGLQDAVLQMRMVPVASLFDTAPRIIRDLTADKQKSVNLVITGGDTELDKRILELMADPLMHLLRNAVDHGIEPVAERQQAGKARTGTIELSAQHRGGHITIGIRDDGRGLDPARLIKAAIAKGIVDERDATRMTIEQAYALIFSPGFSTKEEVTAISGRGVGMDVVKSNIDALKGRIEIDSAIGRGTAFYVHLPLSLSVIQVILVEVAGQSLCLPATGVSEIIRGRADDLQTRDDRSYVNHRGKDVPVVRLSALLGSDDRRDLDQSAIVIATGLEGTVGFVVDRALAEQTVLVKELGKLLRRIPHVAGGTILPNGRVAVILDIVTLIADAIRNSDAWVHEQRIAAPAPVRKTLLVVDDSLTTRELIRGLLEAAGYDVVMARHGGEAWDLLQSRHSLDLVVSDVNMPEMDGYELTSKIKGDQRLSHLPVVLVTSLAKPEEKQRGIDAGADAYIVKGAFDQNGLLARVQELVGGRG